MQPARQQPPPLWRAFLLDMRRSLTLEGSSDRWSHRSAAERASRRAGWPAWRRAVRPAGLAVFWLGVLWSVANGGEPGAAFTIGWALLLLPMAVIGVRDWFRDVPPGRRRTGPSGGRTGDGQLLLDHRPAGAPEHPAP